MFILAQMVRFAGNGVVPGNTVKINPGNILYLEDLVCPINRMVYTKIHFTSGQDLSIMDSSQVFESKIELASKQITQDEINVDSGLNIS